MKIIAIAIAALLPACSIGPTSTYSVSVNSGGGPLVRGSGQAALDARDVPPFDSVVVRGPVDVEIVTGAHGVLELEGDEMILGHVVTRVEKGVLAIELEPGRYRYGMPLRAVIRAEAPRAVTITGSGDLSAADLDGEVIELTLTGSGDMRIERLRGKRLNLTVTGSGDAFLAGRVDELHMSVTGSGDCDASGLVAKAVVAHQMGSGSSVVRASSSLEAELTGSGELIYLGDPEVEHKRTTGSGEIRRR